MHHKIIDVHRSFHMHNAVRKMKTIHRCDVVRKMGQMCNNELENLESMLGRQHHFDDGQGTQKDFTSIVDEKNLMEYFGSGNSDDDGDYFNLKP